MVLGPFARDWGAGAESELLMRSGIIAVDKGCHLSFSERIQIYYRITIKYIVSKAERRWHLIRQITKYAGFLLLLDKRLRATTLFKSWIELFRYVDSEQGKIHESERGTNEIELKIIRWIPLTYPILGAILGIINLICPFHYPRRSIISRLSMDRPTNTNINGVPFTLDCIIYNLWAGRARLGTDGGRSELFQTMCIRERNCV